MHSQLTVFVWNFIIGNVFFLLICKWSFVIYWLAVGDVGGKFNESLLMHRIAWYYVVISSRGNEYCTVICDVNENRWLSQEGCKLADKTEKRNALICREKSCRRKGRMHILHGPPPKATHRMRSWNTFFVCFI